MSAGYELADSLRAEAIHAPPRGITGMPLHEATLPLARATVLRDGRGSISSVQRQLRIGYNAAARFLEHLEIDGLLRRIPSGGLALVTGESAAGASDSEGGTPE